MHVFHWHHSIVTAMLFEMACCLTVLSSSEHGNDIDAAP
jgi:hypothetical protein